MKKERGDLPPNGRAGRGRNNIREPPVMGGVARLGNRGGVLGQRVRFLGKDVRKTGATSPRLERPKVDSETSGPQMIRLRKKMRTKEANRGNRRGRRSSSSKLPHNRSSEGRRVPNNSARVNGIRGIKLSETKGTGVVKAESITHQDHPWNPKMEGKRP